MPETDPIRELTAMWFRHAAEDLAACRVLVRIVDDVPSGVGFHAQQAIEKSLKAVLVAEQIDFPRTHDLVALAQFIPDSWDLELPLEPLAWVSRFAVEMRYPAAEWTQGPELGTADALAALEIAEAIVGRVGNEISARGIEVADLVAHRPS